MTPRRRSGTEARVVRIVEATGSSERGWDAAVADALRGARDEAPAPVAVEVVRLWADVDGRRRLRLYRAAVKIAHRQPVQPPAASRPARSRGRSASR